MGFGVAVAAVALGATVLEKHFTLSRADGGVDSAFSLEPPELAALVVETGRAWQGLGAVSYGATQAEQKSLLYRRSLYVAEDMKAGDVFTAQNLRVVRPGEGLHPDTTTSCWAAASIATRSAERPCPGTASRRA